MDILHPLEERQWEAACGATLTWYMGRCELRSGGSSDWPRAPAPYLVQSSAIPKADETKADEALTSISIEVEVEAQQD